ncbi:mucin-5AC isoform X1 [Plutella xylostella]|uniref:mucin-5AC isoform X1 n=1 Tax=Plutella xylostella TaxID=51655 RepID=UPI00203305C8|nr:mucin-5AC isoform X1 [Plutella xylostella]
MSNRNDEDTEDYVETHTEFYSDEIDGSSEDSERGKRQVRHGRHYYKDGSYKNVGKNWASPKPIKYTDIPQYSFNTQSNLQGNRYQSSFNSLNNNNPFEGTRKPFFDENSFSTANPFISFQKDTQSQRPFKASLPDPRQKNTYNPINPATQIITKSPPISSLNSNDNPFASLAGGFYNNNPQQSNSYNYNQQSNKQSVNSNHNNSPSNHNSFDSSHVSSTVVTGKPVLLQTPREPTKYRNSPDITKFYINNFKNTRDQSTNNPFLRPNRLPTKEFENLNNQDDDEENSSEEDASDDDELSNKNVFPKPPYEFTHPGNKYADIQNPFADPNFDFDEFLAKLRGDHEKIRGSTSRPSYNNPSGTKTINSPVDATTSSTRPSKLNYHGMSTPRPFSMPTGASAQWPNENANIQTTTPQSVHYEPIIQRPSQHQDKETYGEQQHRQQQEHFRQQQQNAFSQNIFNRPQQHNSNPLSGPTKTQLKPPNFNDDRQLPINYKFNQALQSNIRTSTEKPQYKDENKNNQLFLGTQKPYVIVTGTGSPIYFTSPKQQYFSTGKPYSVSSFKPQNPFYAVKPSTPKPLTTIANEQLSILQQFWNKKQEEFSSRPAQPTTTSSAISNHQNSYGHGTKSSTPAYNNGKNHFVLAYSPRPASATTKAPSTRKPIPKPSPEMSDYYYDDDEQYYYEPPVKSQYMPSSEVRPQRPKMAQNYQEYEDSDSYEDESPENNQQQPYRRPANYNKYKTDSSTKTYNDITIVVTKAPPKETTKTYIKNMGNSNSSPSPTQNLLNRPEVSNYKVLHYPLRNKTMHIKRPESGPHTMKPPKYLNQTTLRPYTVRHRLAKPTTVQTQMTQTTPSQDMKSTRGRTRHPNIVTQTRLTTPRDSHNQETRYTKTQHDDKTNSLEPTESVTPIQFSPSPRPKMLYNGSQSYNPDQYDPYYAVYDEDGELYKDTDYVQQYNLASLRPAVQQTYRGTPPPARRPVETYTPRPTIASNDYDEEVLQGQINNQNQYQTPLRHSTRGEGNELGFEINPTTGRTTVYEAPITTTPPTTTSTSTTTTTQRPTVAPFTEAMIPSRYSTRSSTEKTPVPNPDLSLSNRQLSYNKSLTSVPVTSPPIVNFSSLAKPFEKTDNTYRLKDTFTSTERLLDRSDEVDKEIVESVQINPDNNNDKKVVSLTSGFSIRRSPNNTHNPSYTLTVLTKPFDSYKRSRDILKNKNTNTDSNRYYYESDINGNNDARKQDRAINNRFEDKGSSENSMRRTDSSEDIITDEKDQPIYVRPTAKLRVIEPRVKVSTAPTTTSSKFFLKTVIKRPVPFSLNNDEAEVSTENSIDTEVLIEQGLENAKNDYYNNKNTSFNESPSWDQYDNSKESWDLPSVGPYHSLNDYKNNYDNEQDYVLDSASTSTTTTTSTTTSAPLIISLHPAENKNKNEIDRSGVPSTKPSYYTYRVLEDHVRPDQTTEIFSTKAKSILKAFINNFVSTPKPRQHIHIINSTPRTTTTEPEKVVNIGFHKKQFKYVDNNQPLKSNFQRVQIITEPTERRFINPTIETIGHTEPGIHRDRVTSTTQEPVTVQNFETTSTMQESTTNNHYYHTPSKENYKSRFSSFTKENENSQKFQKMVSEIPATESVADVRDSYSNNNEDNELTKFTGTNFESVKDQTDSERDLPTHHVTSTTTRTTKVTTIKSLDPTTSTKSLSFPTRASRVNPAIKLAATNPGGGRRSYQSSSKCSTDNSLQENPKCNEIKYQRPSPTRGRGSAHYSTSGGGAEPPQPAQAPQQTNRGTPPTRSRPTLKPSTSIVSKSTEFVDIYSYPPRRPSAVYPQPTPDKTAAKCRKDVCLLPDCNCGGKEIPGDLPVESVPQIVLLTFDDSVNDLNKVLYQDLFEKGRVNPNGCPISATFYVSHEWTDYSQVQNLYAAGHEMASHTISHSFGEQFSQKKWNREVGGQREILAAYGGVKLEDVRGMRAPFLSVGGNKMFKMLYDSNFTYDSSMPVYENRPPSWPYTLDYKLFHDCMIPPCPTKSYPGVWEVPMVMWQDLNGGRCSMGDACANPPNAEGVYKMLLKNFDRHYTTNRAPFGLFYHAAWFTQPHHKEGFIMFLDSINRMNDVWIVTNWQALQWVRDPTPINRLNNFQPFQCDYPDRPKKCNNPKVCNLWHKSGVRYMRTCQPCPEIYPWTGKTGIRSSRIDNDIEE